MADMLGAIKDLLNSEKAVAGGAIVICATVLVVCGYLPIADWKDLVQWIFVTYVAGKTVTSGVAMLTKKSEPLPENKPVVVEKDAAIVEVKS